MSSAFIDATEQAKRWRTGGALHRIGWRGWSAATVEVRARHGEARFGSLELYMLVDHELHWMPAVAG